MSNVQLLIVDDEERFLKTTGVLMEKRGVRTKSASSGTEALRIIDESPVDVVVLDVKMPGMDGVETLKRIKRNYPLIEVIMLTGHGSVDSAVKGLRMGAYDYVMKPCDIPDLLEKIEDAYRKKQAMEDKIRQIRVDRIISHPMAVFDKGTSEGD